MLKKENQQQHSNQLNNFINTLREETGFERLFSSFREKYKSYGRLENNITAELNKPTQLEKDAIGGLLGEDLNKKKVIKVTAIKFLKAWKGTVYESLIYSMSLFELVELYFGDSLITKKEEILNFLDERKMFFNSYKTEDHPEDLRRIICWAEEEENKNNRLYQQYKQNKELLSNNLQTVSKLLRMFPLETPVYLPMFAAAVTRNPHAFDKDEEKGKFLIYILQLLTQLNTDVAMKPSLNAEEVAELLFNYHILVDDLANDVTVFNVSGRNKDGQLNDLLQATVSQKSSLNLPLREVIKLSEVVAANNIIYMVENSNLASYLISEVINKKLNTSIVCGNGMLTLATIKFLEVFVSNGGTICYAGDFDPEGLGIAQRLINRFGEKVNLWGYTVQNYLSALSEEEISDSRIQQLNSMIKHNTLMEIAYEMKRYKLAGYQENILTKLLENIKEK
ncbi:TIGR02679 domain-containing protein [Robertmurraya kyonggiensis]|uniref:TIGR02679 domain-containing protein n=1 Tax=Robertmurraya kyonggiensis TaxID=1037680 RepID=UPI00130EB073|nr:TIGR02679 domain-containing protein [Robertmurraya kyonggiensis]